MKAKALIRVLERFDPDEEVVLEVTVRVGVMEPDADPTVSDEDVFKGPVVGVGRLPGDWRNTALGLHSTAVLHDRVLSVK